MTCLAPYARRAINNKKPINFPSKCTLHIYVFYQIYLNIAYADLWMRQNYSLICFTYLHAINYFWKMWRQKSDFFKNGFAFFALYSNLYHTHAEGGTSKMGACKLNCKFIRSKNSKGGNFVDKFLLHFCTIAQTFFLQNV